MATTFLRSGLQTTRHYSLFKQQHVGDQGRVTIIGLLALPKERARESTLTFLSEVEWTEPQQSEGDEGDGEPATLRLDDLTIGRSVNLTALPGSLLTLTLTWPLAMPPLYAAHEEGGEGGDESEEGQDEWVDKDGQRMAILRAVSLRCSLWISQVTAALVRPENGKKAMSSQRALWTNECSLFLQVTHTVQHSIDCLPVHVN